MMENKTIFAHYDMLYTMTLATTILANSDSGSFRQDAAGVIALIGTAYGRDKNEIQEYTQVILGPMMQMGLVTDQDAMYSRRLGVDSTMTEYDAMMDIKGDALQQLHRMSLVDNCQYNPHWFSYAHYQTYHPCVRFGQLLSTAVTGNLPATRQVGIMLLLGIGCRKDIDAAIGRLTQCAMWGDVPSIYLVALAYRMAGKAATAEVYRQAAQWCERYMQQGYTTLPAYEARGENDEAKDLFVCIASIRHDVVNSYNRPEIDFSFVEAITSPVLDTSARLRYINHYNAGEWRNVTNSCYQPSKRTGF